MDGRSYFALECCYTLLLLLVHKERAPGSVRTIAVTRFGNQKTNCAWWKSTHVQKLQRTPQGQRNLFSLPELVWEFPQLVLHTYFFTELQSDWPEMDAFEKQHTELVRKDEFEDFV